MDIVTVDVLVSVADGKEYILEFNGTASGFGKKKEDNIVLREFTIQKMNEYFVEHKGISTVPTIPIPEEMLIPEPVQQSNDLPVQDSSTNQKTTEPTQNTSQ